MAIEHEVETTGLVGVDRPALSVHVHLEKARLRILRAEELQLLVLLRLARAARAGDPDRHRHLPRDELQARRERSRSASVEYIMREVPWGWLIRYMHSTGASMFFIVVYLHMFRGLMYGSYRKPRELDVDLRLRDLPVPDGRGVLRLPAAVGPDVVLGRPGDREPVLGDSVHRAGPVAAGFAATTWCRDVHAEPLLRVPRDRDSAGAARPGRRASGRAARSRARTTPTASRSRRSRTPDGIPLDGIPFHPYYTVHDFFGVCVLPDDLRGDRSSSRLKWVATSSKRTTSCRPTRCRRRRKSRRSGTSRPSTRCCAPPTDPFKIVLMIVIALLGLLALVRARGEVEARACRCSPCS